MLTAVKHHTDASYGAVRLRTLGLFFLVAAIAGCVRGKVSFMSSSIEPRSAGADLDADADVVEGRPVPSVTEPLSRERIVTQAVDYLDEHGLAGLTMRRLGASLGVEAMALYRYVPSRDDLLDAVVDHLIGQLDEDEDVLDAPKDGWQDFLQRLAHGVRRVALAHPQAFPLIASRPPQAPWLRPPLRSLRWVELFLAGLSTEGFSDRAAVDAYRAFTSFLLGHLLLEVVARGTDIGLLDQHEPEGGDSDPLAGHPVLSRLRPALAKDESVVEFEESLESLLTRLAQMKSEG